MMFVVDAEFGLEGEDERCNFLLHPEGFTDMNTRKRKWLLTLEGHAKNILGYLLLICSTCVET
jgi:hypothetical protein